MKLNEIKAKLPILDMRKQVKEFCELFAPDNDGDVSTEAYGDHRCYYLFGLQPKQKELFKTWLRKHNFWVSDSYDVHGTGVEWAYKPPPPELQ
jgi:hypothetical protein